MAHGFKLFHGMLGISVPKPGIQPASPALQGSFITIEPPGKSLVIIIVAPESWQD